MALFKLNASFMKEIEKNVRNSIKYFRCYRNYYFRSNCNSISDFSYLYNISVYQENTRTGAKKVGGG